MWIPQDGEPPGEDAGWDEIGEYFAAQKEPMHTVARHVVKRGKNTTSYTLPKERDTEKSYGNTASCGTPGTRLGTARISLPGWDGRLNAVMPRKGWEATEDHRNGGMTSGKGIACVEDPESRLREQDCLIFPDSCDTDLKWDLPARRSSFCTSYDRNGDERHAAAWHEGKKIGRYRATAEILGVKTEPRDPAAKTSSQLCKKHFDFFGAPCRLSDKKKLPYRLYGLGSGGKMPAPAREEKPGRKLYSQAGQ